MATTTSESEEERKEKKVKKKVVKKLRSRSGLPIASAGPVLPAICIICKNKFQSIFVWDRKAHGRGIISPKQKHCQQAGWLLQAAEMKKDCSILLHIQDKRLCHNGGAVLFQRLHKVLKVNRNSNQGRTNAVYTETKIEV
ncbi:uncharacterized protein LOC144018738 [Festucalex cinctus]